jgi:uncharacterized protein (TIGR02271 family)
MANHNDDNVQHGVDDNPSGDPGKGAALGGLGGAAVGAAAGSLVGPAGTLVGAAIGAISGAVASGAAVAAVDAVDNDNTVSGVGSGATGDVSNTIDVNTAGVHTTHGTPNMSNTNQNVDPSLLDTHSATALTGSGTTPLTGHSNSELPRVSRAEYDRLDADGRTRVQLIEEEIHVGKEVREVGEVEISKRVVEENVSVPVTLEREELVITRTAGTTDNVVGNANFTDEVITVPIREEYATVNKSAHVAEEVEIEKRTTQQQTTVGGTVRHEELEVEGGPQSNVRIEGDTHRTV